MPIIYCKLIIIIMYSSAYSLTHGVKWKGASGKTITIPTFKWLYKRNLRLEFFFAISKVCPTRFSATNDVIN